MKTKRFLFLFVSIGVHSWFDSSAAETISTNSSFDDLVYHVVRYGNTEEKRHDKSLARTELLARRADSLRYLMSKIHYENIGLQVLAQNLVEELKKDEVVPVLLDFINDEHTNTQKTAIYFLGFHQAPENADKIRPFLGHEKLRGSTIRTLGKWKVADAALDIATFLRDDNERVRVAAANALRDIGDPRAIPYLIDAQADPVFTVRNTALRALLTFGADAEKAMLSALDIAEDIPLRQLIRGLGELRSVAAEKALRKFATSTDSAVREDALRALAVIELAKR